MMQSVSYQGRQVKYLPSGSYLTWFWLVLSDLLDRESKRSKLIKCFYLKQISVFAVTQA